MIEVQNSLFDRREEFDLFLVVGGYESRSTYLARFDVAAKRRIAIRMPSVNGASYDQNWNFLKDSWEPVLPLDVPSALRQFLLRETGGMPCHIAIDISSMSRGLLSSILEVLHTDARGARVKFLYCPAWFEASSEQAQVDLPLTAEPMSAYFSGAVRPSHLPIGLVVGLGLEPHRADGIREFLEPHRIWPFVAQGLDERFVSNVLEVNDYFLRSLEVQPLRYNIRDISGTFRALGSLCQAASPDLRLVLAPSGPKVFSLAALLVGLDRSVERPAVWRIGPAWDPIAAVDVEAAGEVVACAVRFLTEGDVLSSA